MGRRARFTADSAAGSESLEKLLPSGDIGDKMPLLATECSAGVCGAGVKGAGELP